MTPLLLPKGETAFEAVPLQLLTHEFVLISHIHLDIRFPFFAIKMIILIGKLVVLLRLFLISGHGRGEGDNLSVLGEGEMFKRQKVLLIFGVQSACGNQVT